MQSVNEKKICQNVLISSFYVTRTMIDMYSIAEKFPAGS